MGCASFHRSSITFRCTSRRAYLYSMPLALWRSLDAKQQMDWLQRMAMCVLAGSQVDPVPHLLLGHPVLPAEWSPERTVFSHGESGWRLTLFFKTLTLLSTEGLNRFTAGINVGLFFMAVTAFQSGLVHRASGIQTICLTSQVLERWLPGNLPHSSRWNGKC